MRLVQMRWIHIGNFIGAIHEAKFLWCHRPEAEMSLALRDIYYAWWVEVSGMSGVRMMIAIDGVADGVQNLLNGIGGRWMKHIHRQRHLSSFIYTTTFIHDSVSITCKFNRFMSTTCRTNNKFMEIKCSAFDVIYRDLDAFVGQ